MSMEKYSFQIMTPQTARVVNPPQTPKTLEIPVAGAIFNLKTTLFVILQKLQNCLGMFNVYAKCLTMFDVPLID